MSEKDDYQGKFLLDLCCCYFLLIICILMGVIAVLVTLWGWGFSLSVFVVESYYFFDCSSFVAVLLAKSSKWNPIFE